MNRLAGACRYVWNWSLDQQRKLHLLAKTLGITPPSPTFFALGKSFTTLRHSSGHEWLKGLPCAVVRYAVKRQGDAWAAHFKAPSERGRPKFRSRAAPAGFTIPQGLRLDGDRIHIPKIGQVRLRRRGGNPHADGVPKQAVFKREGGKWYCTVFYQVAIAERTNDGELVGVDLNAGQCATSEGKIIRLPDTSGLEARRRRYQRRMARQVKGGQRRRRTRGKLARTEAGIGHVRANWAHKVSRGLAGAAHMVVVEDLNTKAMTRSAKGSIENPGRNVKAKSGLNRAVLASAWGRLRWCLSYKAGRFLVVRAAYTSQDCHRCGHRDKANRRTQSHFRCQACGHKANADVNAAKNTRRRGRAHLDGEGRGRSKARPGTRQIGSRAQTASPFVHFAA